MHKIIDGADITMPNGTVMQCHALQNLDSETPFNFLDSFGEKEAINCATRLSHIAVSMQLETEQAYRKSVLSESRKVSMPGVNKVFTFVCEELEMEPHGELLIIDDLPAANSSGVTFFDYRTSLVFRNRIVQTDLVEQGLEHTKANILNNLRIETVATHELTHLAGAYPKYYFIPEFSQLNDVQLVRSRTTKLEGWLNEDKGRFFEEGLGTLVQNMYTWKNMDYNSKLASKAKPFESPKGTHVDLPLRNTLATWHIGQYSAWGMEMLIDIEPEIWDICMESRKMGSDGTLVRKGLKTCVDSIEPKLFNRLDGIDPFELEVVMEAANRIGHYAKKS